MEKEKIIYFDETLYNRLINRHEDKTERIQVQIDRLIDNGMSMTTEYFRDVLDYGHTLSIKSAELAKSESLRIFKIPAMQQKQESDMIEMLDKLINSVKSELINILLLHGSNPCESNAWEINNCKITISKEWKKEIKDRFTVVSTPEREEALILANNLKKAIEEINEFAEKYKMFYAGFGISSTHRTICEIDPNWEFIINTKELQNI